LILSTHNFHDMQLQRIRMLLKTIAIVLFLQLFTITPAFELIYLGGGQRRDGSKLFDIYFNIEGIAGGETLCVFITPITQSGETLTCETFISPSDTGNVIGPGDKHIIWDIGTDVPAREFFTDSIMMYISVAGPGFVPGECEEIINLSAGGYHTLALRDDATVWAWGTNASGRLGDGSTTNRYTPRQFHDPGDIGFFSDAMAIAAGDHHSVVLTYAGNVWTCGNNVYGQLGIGSMDAGAHPNVEQVLDETGTGFLTEIIAITAGGIHTLALESDSTVWAFGNNSLGQLGDGTFINRAYPVQVKDAGGIGILNSIVGISAAAQFSIALESDGTVWAWGCNDEGQLGDASTVDTHLPVRVHGVGDIGFLEDIVAISAGGSEGWGEHVLALKSDSTVVAWGDNQYGQLGDNTTNDCSYPVQVSGEGGIGVLSNVIQISTGQYHSIALLADSTVMAWGYNSFRQLGDGTSIHRYAPVRVHGEDDIGYLCGIIFIDAGRRHSAALSFEGAVYCWGSNSDGQLGDGTTTTPFTPVRTLIPW